MRRRSRHLIYKGQEGNKIKQTRKSDNSRRIRKEFSQLNITITTAAAIKIAMGTE